jgi:hypothetical protein
MASAGLPIEISSLSGETKEQRVAASNFVFT